MDRYYALAFQMPCRAVSKVEGRDEARRIMADALSDLEVKLLASKAFIGPDLKLIVLPEYFLTGFPMGDGIEEWAYKAALDVDGHEYERLSHMASKLDAYLCGNAYERDKHFPGLYFQTCFIIAPSGDVVLRYRRLNSMFAATPFDVWDKYLEIYGYDAVFPVVETDIGRLACVSSEEILHPEIARVHALKGAEILLHSTSEAVSPSPTPKRICTLARAVENMAYVVSANTGGIHGAGFPSQSTDGGSKLIDFRGQVLVEAGPGESMSAHAPIDLAALRTARTRPGMGNYLARQRSELFAPAYQDLKGEKPNAFLKDGALAIPPRSHFLDAQKDVINRLRAQGRL